MYSWGQSKGPGPPEYQKGAKRKRVSRIPAPPKDAGKNTDAKENEYIVPANKFLEAVRCCKAMLSGEPSAAAGSDDEPSSVLTECEAEHWNTWEHDESSVDFESAKSPMGSEDYNSDAAMEEATAAAMEKDAKPDAATPDAEDAELNDAPRAEDAERAKQQRRDESVLGSQDEQYHSQRIFRQSRDRSVRVVLKKRDRSREMDRNQTDPSLMSEAPWKRRRGSKDAYLCRSRGHKNRSRSRQMREPMRLKPRWGDEIESEVTLGVLETTRSILFQRSDFAKNNASRTKTIPANFLWERQLHVVKLDHEQVGRSQTCWGKAENRPIWLHRHDYVIRSRGY